jgi:hypothetical protein
MTVVYNIILVDDTVGPFVRINNIGALSALITLSAAAAHNFRRAIRSQS